MQAYIKRVLLLALAVSALSTVLILILVTGQHEKPFKHPQAINPTSQTTTGEQVLGASAFKKNSPLPVRLKIPKLAINAAVEYAGISSEGEMEVPQNSENVAWFKFGPRPGEKGSAVIAGHVDNQYGEAGVFNNMKQLRAGDHVYIEDDHGATIAFVVRGSRTYKSGYAEDVFSLNDTAHLNLVTCNGVWDETKKSYSQRLVVFADILK